MTPFPIAVCLGLAAITIATAAAHLVMASAVLALRVTWWQRLGARTRAGLLIQARLAPLTLSLLFLPLVQLAFWVFEPVASSERVGLALPSLALVGLGLLGVALRRGVAAVVATRRLAQRWRQSAEPHAVEGWRGPAWLVRTPFPVVAVVGVGRAELFVSNAVHRACSPQELAAIAAHERAHVRGHDNLTRLLVAVTPAIGPIAASLEEAWESTAEELADLHSRVEGDGLTLARALTKVARLVRDLAVPRPLPVSTLIGAGSLEARVRRLLAAPGRPGRPVRGATTAAAAAIVVGTALWGLPTLYAAAELLVRLGR